MRHTLDGMVGSFLTICSRNIGCVFHRIFYVELTADENDRLADTQDSPFTAQKYVDRRKACSACVNCDVRTMAVCAALADDELAELDKIMTSRHLAPNEMLVTEGDPLKRAYSLTSGMLRLSIALPDGRRQITGFLLPGDYLGLADDEVHSSTAEAVGSVRSPPAKCMR
jgi:CRP/FNR family transcriptional regulator